MKTPKNSTKSPDLSNLYKTDAQIKSLYQQIYNSNKTPGVGWSVADTKLSADNRHLHTSAVIGVALGDEGKGRTIVNLIEQYLNNSEIKRVIVVRFQGGNNAGHSLETGGVKWAQHQVPSGIHKKNVYGLMDAGMVVHPEDLMHECNLIETVTGISLNGKLAVSRDAILCTDLERAKEVLNRYLSEGAKGGTGRGIGPAYAGHYDRQGLHIFDLLAQDWQAKLTKKYETLAAVFKAFEMDLSKTEVPDFYQSKAQKKSVTRQLGQLQEFLARLKQARDYLTTKNLIVNTFVRHLEYAQDKHTAILFEGSQSVGLDAWLGTYPDVTASNTTLYGIQSGTKFWLQSQVYHRLGVIKATYTSSVGQRRMLTQVDLPFPVADSSTFTTEQNWAEYVRIEAHEFGTTTQRPRDILHLDLGFVGYNAFMGGIEALVVTHMDIAREDEPLLVCWSYQDKSGNIVPYQPGLEYQTDLKPVYVELPSWNGALVTSAKTPSELPLNALRYLAFIQAVTNIPIVALTTGPAEHDYLTFPGYF